MAFGVQQIAPIDTKPGTAVGVSLPFNGPAAFVPTYTTKEATKANLINFLLTNSGERYNNPTFGGNLRKYVFEQLSDVTSDTIQDDITQQIQRYFPNIEIKDVIIRKDSSNIDYNQLTVEINYVITTSGATDTLSISFT